MTTYYINADTGNNTTGDGSVGNPWLTLSKAITSSIAGDTIIVQAATATYTFSAQTIDSRTITGENVGQCVFDGAGVAVSWAIQNNVLIENLTFQNALASSASTGRGMFRMNNTGTSATIQRCIFKSSISINTASGWHNALFGVHAGTISFTVQYCVINGIGADHTSQMIFLGATATTSTIFAYNNTIYLNRATDAQPHIVGNVGPSSNQFILTLKNNIIYSVNSHTWDASGNPTYANGATNCVYNLTSVPAGAAATVTADPLFVDAANSEFRLRPASPCVATGTLI